MPRKKLSAAAKGWKTRRANARKARAAERQRDDKRASEQRKIERLLGEEFDSLAEARRALKAESELPPPSQVDIDSADEYDKYYDEWDDGGIEFEDQGEIDAGVDY